MLGPLREFMRPSGVVNVVAWSVVGAGILDVVSEEGEGRLRDEEQAEAEAGEGASDILVCMAFDDDDGRGWLLRLVLREFVREYWALG